MNILFVIDQYNSHNNGISISTVRFANCLRNEGHDVRIVTTGTKQDNLYIVPERHVIIATRFAHAQGQLFAKPQKTTLKNAIEWCDVAHFIMPWKLSKKGIKIAKKLNKPFTAAFHVQAENVTYNMETTNLQPSLCIGIFVDFIKILSMYTAQANLLPTNWLRITIKTNCT